MKDLQQVGEGSQYSTGRSESTAQERRSRSRGEGALSRIEDATYAVLRKYSRLA